jgi:hypothetical protein
MMELYLHSPLRLHGMVIDGLSTGSALPFIGCKLYGRDIDGYKSLVGEHEYIALATWAHVGKHY